MTLGELIENLEYIRNTHDENILDYDVRTALQPNYPMVGTLMNVCVDNDEKRVLFASSDNEEYGCPRDAWEEEEIGNYDEEENGDEDEDDNP